MMAILGKLYSGLIHVLAVLAVISILVATGLILGDVTMRYLGLGSIRASSTLIEYALLFSTMLGAPWLMRRRGHITVTSLVEQLPPAGRKAAGALALGISTVTLLILGWRSAMVGYDKFLRGGADIRSIAVPEWIAYGILATGFVLMGTECLRLILQRRFEPHGSVAA
ncbi:TRAP transporter small permease [Paracoccus alkanivorans]|uniref:TRAP transporter small permease protein n=2 Tax=Paracoccus alkanivorans TaxID=2116655 RepID=A0A3M0M003_9RHOB|nr:TRAP transporter small permease [Paracoccus alkanivorans]